MESLSLKAESLPIRSRAVAIASTSSGGTNRAFSPSLKKDRTPARSLAISAQPVAAPSLHSEHTDSVRGGNAQRSLIITEHTRERPQMQLEKLFTREPYQLTLASNSLFPTLIFLSAEKSIIPNSLAFSLV